MNQPITLEALEVLDAIERKGSFAAAASQLYKVPSAISYTVQKLEQDLGVTLFVKKGRKSILTPAGRLLLEQGREILQASARLAEATRQADSGWESSIRISVDTKLGVESIFPVLNEFFSVKPDIEINIFEEALGGGWEALSEGRTDLAFGLPDKPSGITDVGCELLGSIEWVFAVPPDHELLNKEQPLTPEDAECYRSVVVRDSALHTAPISFRLFSKQPLLRVPTMEHKIAAQKAGLGIGYLPRYRIQDALDSGELVVIEMAGVDRSSDYYLGWQKGSKGKALRWFIERLKSSVLFPD